MRIRKIGRGRCVACVRSALPGWAVSVLFVLLLYTQNRNFLTLSALGQPLLLASGLALAVWLLALGWCRNLAAASVATAAIMLFNGAHVYVLGYVPAAPIWSAVTEWEEPKRLALAFTGLWLVATCGVLARRRPDLLVRPARIVELFMVANLLFAAARGALLEAQRDRPREDRPPRAEMASAPGDNGLHPTIVNLYLDGYARDDVLRNLYGYDNRPFLEALENMGFRVLRAARCNYIQTALSMASSLNMRYLDDLAAIYSNSCDRTVLAGMIKSSEAIAILRQRGYEIVRFPSGYIFSDQFDADVRWRMTELNELSEAWLDSSLLGSLTTGSYASPNGRHMRRVTRILRDLPKACEATRPRYIFAHVVAPHPPFLFAAHGPRAAPPSEYSINDGSHLVNTNGMTVAAYRAAYVEQLRYVSRRVQDMLAETLAYAGRPLIVIVQSDHGPGSGLDWNALEGSDVNERSAILCAVYFFDGRYERLPDDLTPVNLHRLILSQYFGCDLPPRPNRSYYSSWWRPYQFKDIAERLASLASGP